MTATADRPPMTTPRLRIGIVGAGHFGRYHALKVAASDRAHLAGIHDQDQERAKTIGWEAGAPDLSWDALLAASDAIIVAAPAEAHHPPGGRRAARRQACAGGKANRFDAGAGG